MLCICCVYCVSEWLLFGLVCSVLSILCSVGVWL